MRREWGSRIAFEAERRRWPFVILGKKNFLREGEAANVVVFDAIYQNVEQIYHRLH